MAEATRTDRLLDAVHDYLPKRAQVWIEDRAFFKSINHDFKEMDRASASEQQRVAALVAESQRNWNALPDADKASIDRQLDVYIASAEGQTANAKLSSSTGALEAERMRMQDHVSVSARDVYGQDITDPKTGREYTVLAADLGKGGHAIQVEDVATGQILHSGTTTERNPQTALDVGVGWLNKTIIAEPEVRESRSEEIVSKYAEATHSGDTQVQPTITKPAELESYRQEQLFQGKHTEEQRAAESWRKDAGESYMAELASQPESNVDRRQMEMWATKQEQNRAAWDVASPVTHERQQETQANTMTLKP